MRRFFFNSVWTTFKRRYVFPEPGGAFTTITASGVITGNLTGDVTGNVTGNVTGDVTGSNVTADSVSGSLRMTRVTVGANATVATTTSIVGATAVSITVTLPAANSVNAGYVLIIKDESGLATGGTPITVAAAGTDLIDGLGTTSITGAYGSVHLYSDGAGAWYTY